MKNTKNFALAGLVALALASAAAVAAPLSTWSSALALVTYPAPVVKDGQTLTAKFTSASTMPKSGTAIYTGPVVLQIGEKTGTTVSMGQARLAVTFNADGSQAVAGVVDSMTDAGAKYGSINVTLKGKVIGLSGTSTRNGVTGSANGSFYGYTATNGTVTVKDTTPVYLQGNIALKDARVPVTFSGKFLAKRQ